MNNEGRDLLRTPVPATQKTQVTSTHTACVPIDAIGRRDQSGSRKKRVYVPDVTVVQHPANLHAVNGGHGHLASGGVYSQQETHACACCCVRCVVVVLVL